MKAHRLGRLAVAAIAVPAMLLTACGGGSDEQAGGKLELDFPTWQAEDQSFAPWWNELIDAYEKQHPNVSIHFYQIPFDSYVDQMTTRFASNNAPEIVHLPSRNVPEFASRGWLAPLDDRLQQTDILDSWTPLQEEMKWEDQYYGVLLLGYGYGLYYNEELLDQAGVDVPTTPDELVAAAEAITDGEHFGFGATTQQNPDNYTEFASFVVGNGGSLFEDDGTPEVTSAGDVAAMQQYRDVLANAPQGQQSQQRNELFLNGKLGMLMDGPFLLPELEGAAPDVQGHLKVAAPPFETVPGGVSNSIHMAAGLDDREADAVWDLIELASTPEWQQRYAELAAVPAPREGSMTEAALQKYPQLELFQQLADEAVSIYPQSPEAKQNFGKISDAVSQAAIELISGDAPTGEVAEHLQQSLEGAVSGS